MYNQSKPPNTDTIILAECYTPVQAAKEIGKAPGTLQNWRTIGIGPRFLKDKRNVYYPKAEIERYKKERLKIYSSTTEWKVDQTSHL